MTVAGTAAPRRVGDDGVRIQLIHADDAAWEAALEPATSDVYHHAGYHAVARAAGEGEPYLVVVSAGRRGLAWPYLLRTLLAEEGGPTGRTDVSSVYGYPGPIAWGCRPGDPFLNRAWREIQAAWRDQGAVSAFTRFHPLLDNVALVADVAAVPGGDAVASDAADPGSDHPAGLGIVPGGQTVSVDLTLDDATVRAAYGRDLRREIDASRRKGLTTSVDEAWAALPAFAELYRATMTRTHASSYYDFGEDRFRGLRDCLPGHVHLVVTRFDGEVAAAGLFTEWDGIAQWYLVGSDDAYRSLSPSKVLLDDALRWARDRGNRVMHLGGGRGSQEDALFWFKSRFSPRRHVFHTGRWIIDPAAYRALTDARRAAAGGDRLDRGFFPAYRAPLRAEEEPAATRS